MKHQIEKTDEGIRISAEVGAEKRAAMLGELQKCASGTCACPTPQYDKVQSIEISAGTDGVSVDLKVKPGEVIDMADIERCLEHTAKQLGD
ncbi:MAG: hypothetical protein KAY54_06570 [Burkholderiaceae bacterium]|nr:hypothetical protein [Burkholderiaceae bacterium]